MRRVDCEGRTDRACCRAALVAGGCLAFGELRRVGAESRPDDSDDMRLLRQTAGWPGTGWSHGSREQQTQLDRLVMGAE